MDELFKGITVTPVNVMSLNDVIVDSSIKLTVITIASVAAITVPLLTYVQIMTLLR